jgi:hypothetical protein
MAVMSNTAPAAAFVGGRIVVGTGVPQEAVVVRSSPVIPAWGHPSLLHTGRVLHKVPEALLALQMPSQVAKALSSPLALQAAIPLVLGNCALQFQASRQMASRVSAVGQTAVVPGKEAAHSPLVPHRTRPSARSSRLGYRSRALVPGHHRLPLS